MYMYAYKVNIRRETGSVRPHTSNYNQISDALKKKCNLYEKI